MDVVELLVNKGNASLNVREKSGNTPLISAVLNGHISVVKFLIEKGTRINDRNNVGVSAIDFACSKGNYFRV